MKLRVAAGSRQKVQPASSKKPVGGQNTGPTDARSSEDLHALIAALAYQLYEQRGRGEGHEVEDWLVAEQRVLAGRS